MDTLAYKKYQKLAADYDFIVGIDEAGQGCIAGPLSVGAVCLPVCVCPWGVVDSKQITSEAKRERIFDYLQSICDFFVSTVLVPHDEIDRRGISNCWNTAVNSLVTQARNVVPDKTLFIVDGDHIPGNIEGVDIVSLINADDAVPAVSTASIYAKVTRDRYMNEMGLRYPKYTFGKHKGYPTKQHKKEIERNGICAIHRRSCAPIRDYLVQSEGQRRTGS